MLLTAIAQQAAGVAVNLLNLLGDRQEQSQGELEALAEDLAQALTDVIQWMPERDGDTNQLLGALLRWLP